MNRVDGRAKVYTVYMTLVEKQTLCFIATILNSSNIHDPLIVITRLLHGKTVENEAMFPQKQSPSERRPRRVLILYGSKSSRRRRRATRTHGKLARSVRQRADIVRHLRLLAHILAAMIVRRRATGHTQQPPRAGRRREGETRRRGRGHAAQRAAQRRRRRRRRLGRGRGCGLAAAAGCGNGGWGGGR